MSQLKHLFDSILTYFYTLLELFDPIQSLQTVKHFESSSSSTKTLPTKPRQSLLLWPPLFLLFTDLFGIFGLEYDAKGYLSLSELKHSPYPFIRQVLPPVMWPQTDVLTQLSTSGAIAVYAALLLQRPIKQSFALELNADGALLIANGRAIDSQTSQKMLHIRRFTFRHFYKLQAAIDITLYFYFYINLYLNGHFVNSLASLVFWTVLFPAFIFYLLLALSGFAIILALTIIYIVYQQKAILSKVIKLNRKLSSIENILAPIMRTDIKLKLAVTWFNHKQTRTEMLQLCSLVAEYSRFWSAYLSAAIPALSGCIAYLLYIIFFVDSIALLQKYVYIMGLVAFVVFLFILTRLCTLVITNNELFAEQNATFARKLLQLTRLPVVEQLQMEAMQSREQFKYYKFRFLDGTAITAETFPAIITYTFLFLFLIAKHPKATMGNKFMIVEF